MQRYLLPIILILISVLISLFYPVNSTMMELEPLQDTSSKYIPVDSGEPYSIHWHLLKKLNYKTNQITDEELKKVIDKSVRIPGFAVPLTDNLQAVSEFLLVPNQMACIHAPPPPPNLIVFVRLDKPTKIENLMGPLWIQGTLRLKTEKSIHGYSSFQMNHVTEIKPFFE